MEKKAIRKVPQVAKEDICAALEKRERILDEIRSLQMDLRELEYSVTERLVGERYFDLFSVNWRRATRQFR